MMATLDPLDTTAMFIRHSAALKIMRADPGLSPEEALLFVVSPSDAVLEASLEAARKQRKVLADLALDLETGCGRCYGALDEDGFCIECGGVTSPGGELLGSEAL